MTDLHLSVPPEDGMPDIALAVRQPWAWAIIYGGKDIENRTVDAIRAGRMYAMTRIVILASKGMTREEYETGMRYINRVNVDRPRWQCPPAHKLQRGGIIGTVTVKGITRESASPWFIQQARGRGLELGDPEPCEFVPRVGELGYFNWRNRPPGDGPAPALPWMLGVGRVPRRSPAVAAVSPPEPDLFGKPDEG